ncbi:MAG: hypothetical protein ACM3VS_12910 [Candidatus Dadabacteria bacterium]
MKKNFAMQLLTSCFLLLSVAVTAQMNQSGIYMTADDYKAQKLNYATSYNVSEKINDFVFLDASQVKVTYQGKTITLNKDDVFGYRNNKGEDFRFVDNNSYRILNPGQDLLIYEYTRPGTDPRERAPITNFFFTRNINDNPRELTKDNLRKAFRDNKKFQGVIYETFKNDEDLLTLDNIKKMYKLNTLYNTMVKQ